MKYFVGFFMILLFAGCASSPEREIASYEPDCSLEKHPKKNWYRLKVFDRPMNDKWYTKEDAEAYYKNYKEAGRCQ